MKTKYPPVVGVMVSFIWAAAALGAPPQLTEQRTPLGRLDPRPFGRIIVSPDQGHVAWQRRIGNQVAMLVDGAVSRPLDSIDDPVFSPDAARALYLGHLGENAFLLLDGKTGPAYRGIHDAKFSPDSRHVLYVARTGADEESLFLDGVQQGRYRFIHIPSFGPCSTTVAYDATKGTEAQHVLVRNGIEGPEGGAITDIVFSPDGKHLACIRRGDDGQHVTLDGRERGAYQRISGLMFSADSRHLAYEVIQGNQAFVVLDDKPQKPLSSIMRFDFSPQGGRYMYVGLVGPGLQGGMIGMVDGSEFGPFSEINLAAFSRDGSRLAFRVMRAPRGPMTMWVDGIEQKPYAQVDAAVFSPDDKHVAYPVRFDAVRAVANQAIVLDGVPGPAYDGAWDPTFSPDSKHFAYRAFRRGLPRDGQRIVLDMAEAPIYDAVSRPVFSVDGRHCAYLATDDRKSFAVVDGQESKKTDGLVDALDARPVFDGTDRFHFLAIDSGEVVRIAVRLSPGGP